MRFSSLSIDGYGRFVGKELKLDSGLHVIAGPNERGKSTLRYFISDMLYGQKRSSTRRLYEESNELRAPWESGNGYGGRIRYSLDSGREFEVERSFHHAKEMIRVFDRTDAREVTKEFAVLKNRESLFAEEHLKMTKSVFLGIATISHVSLSDLGDKQALISIREKLLSLADVGGEESSAEKAVKWLQDRIASIGQPTARTKPLPFTRQRLTDLQAEFQEVHEAAKEVESYEKQRSSVLGAIGSLIYRRTSLESQLRLLESAERAERLRKAEELEGRIEAITKKCFALGAARDFPSDRLPEAQRNATLFDTATQKARRTQEKLEELNEQFNTAATRLEDAGVSIMKEANAEIETRLAELDSGIGRLNDRLKISVETHVRADIGRKQASDALATMTDFSEFLPDPVEYFSELASQFRVAHHTLEDEESRLERVRAAIEAKKEEHSEVRDLFSGRDGFISDLRSYEGMLTDHHGATGRFEQEKILLRQQGDDLRSKLPGFIILALISLGTAGIVAVTAQLTGNESVFVPAVILGIMFLFFSFHSFTTWRGAGSIENRIAQLEKDERDQHGELQRERVLIEDLMERASCQAPRELEALYDRYQQNVADLTALEKQENDQQGLLEASRAYLAKRREEVLSAFESAGTTVDGDDDVQAASTRVLTRYQEYRDAKRLTVEFKEALRRLESEESEIDDRLKALKAEELDLSLEVREFLRSNHYPEEKNFDSALKALRAYRIRSAQSRKNQGEIDIAQGQIKIVRRQLDSEQAEIGKYQDALARQFSEAGVSTITEFEEGAQQAQAYKELWTERSAIQNQLDAVLGDEDIEGLRLSASESEKSAEGPKASTQELKGELDTVNEDLDSKRKQEHALHLMMTERAAGLRTLNEVDEERAATEQRMAELELELQAAAAAISVIEEVTREQHSRIAPQLANLASGYLKEITNGVYDELLVDQDMQISVRIPETKSLNSDPERRLSKGTVDQIYFALRLAMVQSMSHNSESIPMVLDDPFANYDDTRLACAMRLLARIGETNQVLLFTCREDVVRAAEAVNAPVLRL